MLPIMQTFAAAKQLWSSLDERQKALVDLSLSRLVPAFLAENRGVNPQLIEILQSERPLEEKVALIASNPKLLGNKKSAGNSRNIAIRCPHCDNLFLKDLDHGSETNS